MVIFFGPSHRFRPDLLDTDELVQYIDTFRALCYSILDRIPRRSRLQVRPVSCVVFRFRVRTWLSGRASASQAVDRGFESRRPLQFLFADVAQW